MENSKRKIGRGGIFKTSMVILFLFSLAIGASVFLQGGLVNSAKAVDNLINGGSFEDDLERNWVNWKAPSNTRDYDFHRSYEASSFGNGSYSAAITASGTPQDEIAGIISDGDNNSFRVEGGQHYYLSFYAKATQDMDIFSFLEDKNQDYAAMTDWKFSRVTTDWQKYLVEITPTSSAESAVLMIGYNNMPEGATLYLDGINFFKKNIQLKTGKVKGKIGHEKNVNLNNLSFFNKDDVRVELPYYNGENGQLETTRLEPTRTKGSRVYFNMEEGTFSGIGRVYVAGEMVGEFQYEVLPEIDEISPVKVRGGSNLVVYGSGFIPKKDNTFLVLKVKDTSRDKENKWLKYSFVDSDMSSITFETPANVVLGSMYIVTSYANSDGEVVEKKSNSIDYTIKPRIDRVEWSKKGYEQVGDKIKIYGRGIAGWPSVYFYDQEGERVGKTVAKKLVANEDEVIIEVKTPQNINELSVTVYAGGGMSNKEDALTYVAKPKLRKINAQKYRKIDSSSPKIPASKVGRKITLVGNGFNIATGTVAVEFQGLQERVTASVTPENIKNGGTKIVVTVPTSTQNGYTNVVVNGKKSNYLPLEIIPSVVDVSPDNIQAGEEMSILAAGVGDNPELTKVFFDVGRGQEVVRTPSSTQRSGDHALIRTEAPVNLANSQSSVKIQYDRWSSDEEFDLHVPPHISRASINMDNNILTIYGHGFSLDPKDNKITYKYADENKTVIDPDVKKLGVYPTEEGQEIRIKVKDDYHYGYVTVQVGEEVSNEVNFGPVKIKRLARRVEYIESEGRTRGVLYISGYNFGEDGGVRVGDHWADVHYRSEFFIIAVIEQEYLYDNPVIIARNR